MDWYNGYSDKQRNAIFKGLKRRRDNDQSRLHTFMARGPVKFAVIQLPPRDLNGIRRTIHPHIYWPLQRLSSSAPPVIPVCTSDSQTRMGGRFT